VCVCVCVCVCAGGRQGRVDGPDMGLQPQLAAGAHAHTRTHAHTRARTHTACCHKALQVHPWCASGAPRIRAVRLVLAARRGLIVHRRQCTSAVQAPAHQHRSHAQAPVHQRRSHAQAPAHQRRSHAQAPAHQRRSHAQAPVHQQLGAVSEPPALQPRRGVCLESRRFSGPTAIHLVEFTYIQFT
jgi:hypothetical protein